MELRLHCLRKSLRDCAHRQVWGHGVAGNLRAARYPVPFSMRGIIMETKPDAQQISKGGISAARFISINEFNSHARNRLDLAAQIKNAELACQKAQAEFYSCKDDEQKKTLRKQSNKLEKQLNSTKKKDDQLRIKMNAKIDANLGVYAQILEDDGAYDKATFKITEETNPVANEYSTRVSVDTASVGFIDSMVASFADMVGMMAVRKDALVRHFDRLVNIVSWADRLKDSKYWGWLKPVSNTKFGALIGSGGALILSKLTSYADPFLVKIENFVRLFPKTQEGKDLASISVKPVFYLLSTASFALFGFLNDVHKESAVRRLESTKVRKLENIEKELITFIGLLHRRIMLQICDIKLGHDQLEDVLRYNGKYVAMFRNKDNKFGEFAWEVYYQKEVADNLKQRQDLLSRKEEPGVLSRAWRSSVQMAKDTAEWGLACADYLINSCAEAAAKLANMAQQSKDAILESRAFWKDMKK